MPSTADARVSLPSPPVRGPAFPGFNRRTASAALPYQPSRSRRRLDEIAPPPLPLKLCSSAVADQVSSDCDSMSRSNRDERMRTAHPSSPFQARKCWAYTAHRRTLSVNPPGQTFAKTVQAHRRRRRRSGNRGVAPVDRVVSVIRLEESLPSPPYDQIRLPSPAELSSAPSPP